MRRDAFYLLLGAGIGFLAAELLRKTYQRGENADRLAQDVARRLDTLESTIPPSPNGNGRAKRSPSTTLTAD